MVNNPKDSQGSAVSVAPQEDGALLFRAKNQDSEAIRALIERYTPLVHRLSRSFEGVPSSEWEDLAQEGFLALHKAILFYDCAVSSFSTFAYLCVRRSMLSALKKYNRRAQTVSYDTLEEEPISEEFDPQTQMVDRENYLALLRRLEENLSEYENRVLSLTLSGKSISEVAILLEKSEKSVSNALFRARGKISSLLS